MLEIKDRETQGVQSGGQRQAENPAERGESSRGLGSRTGKAHKVGAPVLPLLSAARGRPRRAIAPPSLPWDSLIHTEGKSRGRGASGGGRSVPNRGSGWWALQVLTQRPLPFQRASSGAGREDRRCKQGGEARAPWDLRALSGGPGSTWAHGGPGEARSLHTRLLSNRISSVTT